MPNEAATIAALFRRALRPRPDQLAVERDAVEKLVKSRYRAARAAPAASDAPRVFARVVVELAEQGWASSFRLLMAARTSGWGPTSRQAAGTRSTSAWLFARCKIATAENRRRR